jgi:steroid Delta-isomerase
MQPSTNSPPESVSEQRQAVARVAAFFEGLKPADVARMGEFYTQDAYFKDPFNEVHGIPEVQRIFRHMYEVLDGPRFVIHEQIIDGAQCFLTWDFEFRFKRFDKTTLQTVRGGSHLKLNSLGLVTFHRDYWDAAEELYEKLPVVGGLMRWLKRQAG